MAYTPDQDHRRPDGADDQAVKAAGMLSEALETVERARGHLYSFHQLTGSAHATVAEVVDLLDGTGHDDLARRLAAELLGRDVLPGRWTFQIVEEYDDDYYAAFRELEREVRDRLMAGRRHVYEAELKQRSQAAGEA
ncbi:hypothetical protein Nocox_28530 [Nonomuraea coxensis DSM 45129]|uniref:Uncharacterized protein n=1 Tax=Nonomuraea coxensis DSM 45129 TaxID=1122611 RepID=A0ABX8U6H8_9ACTN|nr:hypothetical protein [Nonomuraea coxensis]QYC43295.1 hypothetical protein Nocox_28530 [Nonomuraea coxensis DSM 45129]